MTAGERSEPDAEHCSGSELDRTEERAVSFLAFPLCGQKRVANFQGTGGFFFSLEICVMACLQTRIGRWKGTRDILKKGLEVPVPMSYVFVIKCSL